MSSERKVVKAGYLVKSPPQEKLMAVSKSSWQATGLNYQHNEPCSLCAASRQPCGVCVG